MPKETSPSFTRTSPFPTPPTKSWLGNLRSWIPNISTRLCHSPNLRQPTTPGGPMALISMVIPFRKSLPLAQTDPQPALSLSLSGQKTGQKQKGQNRSVPAQFMALVSALGSLSSVALPSARVPAVYHLSPSSLPRGDISTLQ